IGQRLSERLGRPFVVENRPGAGSNIATEAVVRAGPDGLTLLLVGTPNAINTTLYEKLEFDFIRDIAPVAGLIRGALVMVIHPSVPAKTLPEFVDYAKAHPGKLSYGSGGVGELGKRLGRYRIHRLCQGEPGQALLRFGRRRRDHPHHRRAI